MANVQIPESTFFNIYFLLRIMDASALDDTEREMLSEIMPVLETKFNAISKRTEYAANLARKDASEK